MKLGLKVGSFTGLPAQIWIFVYVVLCIMIVAMCVVMWTLDKDNEELSERVETLEKKLEIVSLQYKLEDKKEEN